MWIKDLSLSAIVAGFVAVLVGFASSVAIVLQAAAAAGATQDIMASWLLALGIGMAATCIGLSWYYKAPVITAWSTPGAALLAGSLQGLSINEAVAVFIFTAALGVIIGISGWFDKLTRLIPLPLASAMLAGILLQFGLSIFTALHTQLLLVGLMCVSYLLAKRLSPRYAILWVLLTGVVTVLWQGQFATDSISLSLTTPVWVTPHWSVSALLGVGLPLLLVTMASQNIPGVAVIRTSGYQTPVSPLISSTALSTLLLAPWGAFSINLAAITAAICTGPEAHPDKDKRYIAGIAAGVCYLLAGLAGATVVALFSAFPKEMIAALAGLALLGTIGANLAVATAEGEHREAAVITLLVTASGVSFFGIAAAFWGIVAGGATLLLVNSRCR
ncbi:MAG: benzoate/H(+) symporter BenE family transporter [Gammaproteobacteria bacterium]|nr:benzoate/H(+) symporter BenE family transporter [Gammaproteobacteria bacterium]MBU1555752.1 benzoate/H(+) symporter BenE family transporter [Gammaproteobacteria bacterium]MBU2071921.1 benzoate/H(+) symporter BenE family transporter [Gammaproteobacteria bacterium]MBU2181782.1 benzoate/H(+) symporter BenE family transporter [Gammaproteobacteria bacterium]MBU2206370.1 benzoate/H(+) symporter BenE family transporter [Gammaproteobacteria bacterium]